MMAVNVTGQIICAREAVLRHVDGARRAGGSIVFVSSAASRVGSPGMYVDYAAVEGRDRHATLGLVEGGGRPRACGSTACAPGSSSTEIHADSGDVDRPAKAAASLPLRPPRRTRGGRRRDRVADVATRPSYTTAPSST